ncbi:MAG: response regulator transcription factor [Leptolyngbya sp. UWPOB_LEPTO1]|uniref:response regulator transcription factor n=1 Tax=Leptolyngbya sp. UWPOB_LEPTO1 TaxID=2815653 RepID=UPI001AC1C72B|nr:response regulator transcription factor [Leptolyngbya sp. UWPOB_LEPTO1]MBN8564958.1 response regulator transcription factor [Leptolyngbya sp. UWPOB_LEPTO1]
MHYPRILIIDDHPLVLDATLGALRRAYPDADVIVAQVSQEALEKAQSLKPDVAIVDLSMPRSIGEKPQAETGLQLLKDLMQGNNCLNIVVQSADPRPLIRLKSLINDHEGGFTIADKQLSSEAMLRQVELALQGLSVTSREMRIGLEMKADWLTLLQFAFVEGLTDSAISERMNVAERTVRHYWTKIQDALEVYPEKGKNIRIQTEMRAREMGLLD